MFSSLINITYCLLEHLASFVSSIRCAFGYLQYPRLNRGIIIHKQLASISFSIIILLCRDLDLTGMFENMAMLRILVTPVRCELVAAG